MPVRRKQDDTPIDGTPVAIPVATPENPDPVVATLDLPPEEIATAIENILPEGAVVTAAPDEGVKIPAETWAASNLKTHHAGGFLAWARGQQIQSATVKEWRAHHDTYRNARVR